MKNARLFALAMLAAAAVATSAQTVQVSPNNRAIAVTVTDKATAEADIATVHIGFESYAADANMAYSAGSRTSNAVIDALHKAGIVDKAVESEAQNLRRTEFDDSDKESVAERAKKQFTLTQSWTVHTSSTEAKNVLNIAVRAGANSSGQIDWDVKDRASLQAQAAAKALQHARGIADQMAQGLNTHLGSLLYASNEAPELGPRPIGNMGAIGGLVAKQQIVAPLAVRPQQIEENATVYAVFQIQ